MFIKSDHKALQCTEGCYFVRLLSSGTFRKVKFVQFKYKQVENFGTFCFCTHLCVCWIFRSTVLHINFSLESFPPSRVAVLAVLQISICIDSPKFSVHSPVTHCLGHTMSYTHLHSNPPHVFYIETFYKMFRCLIYLKLKCAGP